MVVYGALILTLALCGQDAREAAPATPMERAEGDEAGQAPVGPLVPVLPPKRVPKPRQLLAEACTPPESGALTGRGLPLAEALAVAPNAPLEVIRQYWQLSAALAEHHFALDEYLRLAELAGPAIPPPAAPDAIRDPKELAYERMNVELSTWRARLREAELKALRAQHELAANVGRSTASGLPLPADRPHVGPYRTEYDKLLAQQNANPRLRLIHGALPLQLRLIQARTEAVVAADDALRSITRAFEDGEARMGLVVARLQELSRQRRDFLADVKLYNTLIAEYAVAVAGNRYRGEALAPLLIRTPRSAPRDALPPPRTLEPKVPQVPNDDAQEPTLAVPPDADVPPTLDGARTDSRQSHLVARQSGSRSSRDRDRFPLPAVPPIGDEPLEGVRAPANRDNHVPAPPTVRPGPRPIPDQRGEEEERDPDEETQLQPLEPDARLYSAAIHPDQSRQTHTLSLHLHWDRWLPPEQFYRVTLGDLLQKASGDRRQEAILAYWRARESVARYQVASDMVMLLRELLPLVLRQRFQDYGPTEMLQLQAARWGARADLLSAHTEVYLACQHLAEFTAGNNSRLPLPVTPPHASRYRLGTLADRVSLPATSVASLYDVLQERAATVVFADLARAETAAEYKNQRQSLDELIWTIEAQRERANEFLSTLTSYNEAIALLVQTQHPGGDGATWLKLLVVAADADRLPTDVQPESIQNNPGLQ